MSKLNEASNILFQLDVPIKQRSKIAQLTLLALAGISEGNDWAATTNQWIRIHDIIQFVNDHYGETYAENSRETFRKQALHHFRNAAFIEDNGKPTNSPNYRYRLTDEMASLLRTYGSDAWEYYLQQFRKNHDSLIKQYSSKKMMQKHEACVNGVDLKFSPGKHNLLQIAVLEEFAPRFAPGSICLYVGDTTDKDLIREDSLMRRLGINLGAHEKLPDVMLYSETNNWVYFIECVTSVGPISPKRVIEINDMISPLADFGKIYVTAFPDMKTMKKFINEIAWESEIWLSDEPDHMIHLNGDKFLGPRH